jgi:hypothetical protein
VTRHVAVVVALGVLSLAAAGCDPSPGGTALSVGGSSLGPGGAFSPLPIGFNPLAALQCPGGFGFRPSFFLNITAGPHDLTLDHVTLHLNDGSNLGGPMITIPRIDLAGGSGTTIIRAGSTRGFGLRPAFDCVFSHPRSLFGTAFLFDPIGVLQTMTIEGRVQ